MTYYLLYLINVLSMSMMLKEEGKGGAWGKQCWGVDFDGMMWMVAFTSQG